MAVPPYVGMARKQNGGYNASISVQTPLVHPVANCTHPNTILLKKCTNKPVKRFQMKSNGCRDVQHTGLQSTQTRRNTGKQGAQTRGTRSAHLPKHPYTSGCIIIVGYANQFEVTKIEKKLCCKSIQGYKKLKKLLGY